MEDLIPGTDLKIRIIRLAELKLFIDSSEFRTMPELPISYHRALYYLNNERGKQEDPVLFLLYKQEKLVAYRTLLADSIFIQANETRFFWISGTWVHQDFRRQGFASLLLKEVQNRTENNLMYSNYAEASKSVYDKSGLFEQVANLSGKRYYLRSCLSDILPGRSSFFSKIKPVLVLFDKIANLLFIKNIKLFDDKKDQNFEEIDIIDDETKIFIEKSNKINPFKRSKAEFDTIFQYNWIISNKSEICTSGKYFFSSTADFFKYYKFKIFDNNRKIIAFMIVKIRNNILSVPYVYTEITDFRTISSIILSLAKKHNIIHITTFNRLLIRELDNNKKSFITAKSQERRFFATHNIAKAIKSGNYEFFEGDGDNVFT